MMRAIIRLARGIDGALRDRLEPTPSLVGIPSQEIGRSAGGLPIEAWVFGDGPRAMLIFAGIHGNEVGTVKLARRVIRWLRNHLPRGVRVWIIPCLNPDGFIEARKKPEYFNKGRIGRFNAHDVDLNRNFPVKSFTSDAMWNRGPEYQERVPVFAGNAPGSEPETQALISLIEREKISIVLAYHSVGPDILPAQDTLSRQLAETYAKETGFPLVSEEMWKALQQTGTPKEWCEARGISFVEVECERRWSSGWGRHGKAIAALMSVLSL